MVLLGILFDEFGGETGRNWNKSVARRRIEIPLERTAVENSFWLMDAQVSQESHRWERTRHFEARQASRPKGDHVVDCG